LYFNQNGPLVYCAEGVDNQGIALHHVLMAHRPQFSLQPGYAIVNTEGDGKPFQVTAINVPVQEVNLDADCRISSRNISLRLIPYYAWNHRAAGTMDVWLASSLKGLDD